MKNQFNINNIDETIAIFESKSKNIEINLTNISNQITNLKSNLSIETSLQFIEKWNKIQTEINKAKEMFTQQKEKVILKYEKYKTSTVENDNKLRNITQDSVEKLNVLFKEFDKI